MQNSISRYPRILVNGFFIYLSAVTIVSGFLITKYSRNWVLANWLINYEGGFVRRGFAGEIYFLLGRLLHVKPEFFVLITWLILYTIFFSSIRRLLLESSMNFWVVALIVSPATLSFQVLHPRSGFGKETIHFAALSLFAFLLRRSQLSTRFVVIFLSVYFVFTTLAHEGNAFFSIYFFAALVVGGRTFKQAVRESIIPYSLAAITAWICSRSIGDYQTVQQICSSLGYRLNVPGSFEVCSGGAIPYLFRTREFAHADLLKSANNYQYYLIFPFFAVVALLPAIGESALLIRARERFNVALVWACLTASFIVSLPLFYYAVDWGRWIYIHVTSLTVLLVFLDAQRRQQVEAVSVTKAKPRLQQLRLVACTTFVLAYGTLWILPTSVESLKLGYVGRLLYLSHFNKDTVSEARKPIHF